MTTLFCRISLAIILIVMGMSSASADILKIWIYRCTDGGCNRLWVAAGGGETGAESCEEVGSTCYIVIQQGLHSANGSQIIPLGLVVNGRIDGLEARNTITSEVDPSIPMGGFTFMSDEAMVRIVEYTSQPQYVGATISMSGVTLALDGSFTITFPYIP